MGTMFGTGISLLGDYNFIKEFLILINSGRIDNGQFTITD